MEQLFGILFYGYGKCLLSKHRKRRKYMHRAIYSDKVMRLHKQRNCFKSMREPNDRKQLRVHYANQLLVK